MDENPYKAPVEANSPSRKRTLAGYLMGVIVGCVAGFVVAQVICWIFPFVGNADTGDAALGGLVGVAVYLLFGGRRELPTSNA
jgi:hypothetical protein